MDVKIGFKESTRQLAFSSDFTQEQLEEIVSKALESSEGVTRLHDEKGNLYVMRNADISFVEIGTENTPSVGFAGI